MRLRQVLPRETEKQVQAKVKQLLDTCGVAYYDTSQPFRAAITPGVPDLLCFCPSRGFFVVEVKAEGGTQSLAQIAFQRHCEAVGVPYLLGGVESVRDFLIRPKRAG